MSLFTESSLCLVPSGVKDGKVYSIKPTDGSGDLTFSRGSDIEATRVASNGYIEKAKVNLLLQSNTFSNPTWSITAGSSVTGGQSGYDGSNDAWLLTDGGFSAAYCLYQSYASSGVQTASIYAKQGSTSQIEIDFFGGTGGYIRVELTDGSLHSTLNLIDYSVESVGGGWWRISFASNLSSTALFRMGCNGAGSVYIQDAQLNYGLVAQEYQETTTTSVVSGITNDMPRLDYSGGASCPSLKLEPSRTNLIAFSEYYGAGSWASTDVNLTTNYALSPEGKMNASLWEFSTNDTSARIQYVLGGLTTGATYTQSYYIKSLSGDLTLRIGTSGAVIGEFEDITATSEWQRFDFTSVASDTTEYPRIQNISGTQGARILVYGAQFELGSYPTSYIPTYGTSATRTADSCSKTGISSLIGQTAGTLFVDFTFDSITSENRQILQISDGSANILHFRIRSSNELQAYGTGNFAPFDERLALTIGGRYKVALGYSNGDFAYYVNGVQIATDTQSTTASNLSEMYLGINNLLTTPLGGTISQAILFKTRLSNSDLAALTSL